MCKGEGEDFSLVVGLASWEMCSFHFFSFCVSVSVTCMYVCREGGKVCG